MGPAPSHGGTFVPPLPMTIRIAAKNPCGALLNQHDTDFGDESLGGSIRRGHGHRHQQGQMSPQGHPFHSERADGRSLFSQSSCSSLSTNPMLLLE
mmetsp:Transcript_2268/g.4583  ORF Transcript_2268/g.4583 Transcript_2268/m.4583 type:complete len:96 (-) Transcript_2268:82-369(-)